MPLILPCLIWCIRIVGRSLHQNSVRQPPEAAEQCFTSTQLLKVVPPQVFAWIGYLLRSMMGMGVSMLHIVTMSITSTREMADHGSLGWMYSLVQKSCNHQLRLVVYPIIYKGFSTIPGRWPWDFWTINRMFLVGSSMCFGSPDAFASHHLTPRWTFAAWQRWCIWILMVSMITRQEFGSQNNGWMTQGTPLQF